MYSIRSPFALQIKNLNNMALDITVNDSHDKPEMSIPLFMEDYDSIMKKIENMDGFDIIKKSLSDYYGEVKFI